MDQAAGAAMKLMKQQKALRQDLQAQLDDDDRRPSVGEHVRLCVGNNQKRQRKKRTAMRETLKDRYGRLIGFGSAARKTIKPETTKYIESVNTMDLKLHAVVQSLFDELFQKLLAAGRLSELPEAHGTWDRDHPVVLDSGRDAAVPPPPEKKVQPAAPPARE